ncbi:hypothetical protein [Elioraea sp.]|uniref:hypothetical protein n=1 Tax=Elioraea sp. TaxID=2185103 RepID=UPI0025C3C80D|nr:hypothetical protein [Elioraea sp.]
MTRSTHLAAVLILGASWLATPANAQLTLPDCEALAGWATGYQRGAQWRPNEIGTQSAIPSLYAAPATAQLLGKPVIDWSEAEVRALFQHMQGCERQFAQARQFDKRNPIDTMRGWLGTNVAAMLRNIAAAREAVPQALAALEPAPASPQLLQLWSALSRATSQQGFNAASQASGQLQGDVQVQARALLAGVRNLPQAEIGPAVVEKASARAGAMRGAVRDQIVAEIGAVPASAQSLQALAAAPQALRQRYGAALGPEEFRAIDQAIASRRTAIGDDAEKEIVAQLAAVTPGPQAFAEIDRQVPEPLFRILPPANAEKVRAAADAQRKAAADAIFTTFQRELSGLPQTQDGIDRIDGEIKPALAAWPQSAAPYRQRFAEAADSRRTAILAVVDRAERGSLRGRTYESQAGLALEFVDRTRVFFKTGGQTAGGTYTEERDGRVTVTVNNQSMVLTREGRVLTGGPTDFRRTK